MEKEYTQILEEKIESLERQLSDKNKIEEKYNILKKSVISSDMKQRVGLNEDNQETLISYYTDLSLKTNDIIKEINNELEEVKKEYLENIKNNCDTSKPTYVGQAIGQLGPVNAYVNTHPVYRYSNNGTISFNSVDSVVSDNISKEYLETKMKEMFEKYLGEFNKNT